MLLKLLGKISKDLTRVGVDHALIGGLALGAHGVQRYTDDIDFLVDEEDAEKVISLFESDGFDISFRSSEVIQFDKKGQSGVDILLARRPLSRSLLNDAKACPPASVKCVSVEGIIALKVQAYMNDKKRELQDKADIQALIEKNEINWKKLKPLVDLFSEWEEIKRLRRIAGK